MLGWVMVASAAFGQVTADRAPSRSGVTGESWHWASPPIPSAPVWRDAALPWRGVWAHAAAVDTDGTLFLATIEVPEDGPVDRGALRVRAWEGGGWTERFGWPVSIPEDGADLRIDLAVDTRGHAWVAWSADCEALHVLGEHEAAPWTTSAPPGARVDVVGLDATTQPASLVLGVARANDVDDPKELWHFDVGNDEGRRLARGDAVAVARAYGRTALTVSRGEKRYDVVGTWPPTRRRPSGGWRAPTLHPTRTGHRWVRKDRHEVDDGGGPGRRVTADAEARFVGTHYGSEVNRLVIRQAGRIRPLAPPGTRRLRVPHRLQPDHALYTTPVPMLVLGLGGQVGVLRWTGSTWWGLDATPDAPGGLGDPQRPSTSPAFDGAVLRWVEQHDERGDHVVEQAWTGRTWGATTRRAARARVQFLQPVTNMALARTCDECTWDRLWGHHDEPRLLDLGTAHLREVPHPSVDVCGGDAEHHRCAVRDARRGRDGVLRAVVWLGDRSYEELPARWSILRWTGSGWIAEASRLEGVPLGADATLVDLDPPMAVFLYDAWPGPGDDTVTTHAVVASHAGEGWQIQEVPALQSSREREGTSYSFTGGVAGATGSDGHPWLVWRRPLPGGGSALAVAERTSAGWVRREAGLGEEGYAGAPSLVVDAAGRATLAWAGAEGVEVRRFRAGAWEPVAPEPVWEGLGHDPALGWLNGRLCVAFSAATSRAAQIGVRCLGDRVLGHRE